MTTYKELQSQIERLQQEAELARKTELANAITEILAKMREYGLSPHDLGFSGGTKRKAVKAIRRPVAPKYRNNATAVVSQRSTCTRSSKRIVPGNNWYKKS
jgi:DNA-binding protein H-NS